MKYLLPYAAFYVVLSLFIGFDVTSWMPEQLGFVLLFASLTNLLIALYEKTSDKKDRS